MMADALPVKEWELTFIAIRASGPGGQNVNKVSSAIQMRFSVVRSPSLADDVKQRLLKLASHLATNEGELVITAERFRTQERNKQDAIDRLTALIEKAKIRPKRRIATKPTYGSTQRRLASKAVRSGVKQMRQKADESEV